MRGGKRKKKKEKKERDSTKMEKKEEKIETLASPSQDFNATTPSYSSFLPFPFCARSEKNAQGKTVIFVNVKEARSQRYDNLYAKFYISKVRAMGRKWVRGTLIFLFFSFLPIPCTRSLFSCKRGKKKILFTRSITDMV